MSTPVYMLFPEYLEPFLKEAKELFLEKKVLEVIFSGPTYQVRTPDETWVFVQLNQEGRVKDIFCQCDRCQEEGACIHMATALIAIGDNGILPLHIQFEKSPFFAAFSPLSQKGLSHKVKKGEGKLTLGNCVTLSGKDEWINDIFKDLLPKEETEETSIKFSDLSEEEIENWRKGIVSDRLKFELSPYADIAKKLFLLSKKELPSYSIQEDALEVHWKECSVKLPILSDKNLVTLLDTLPPERTTPDLFPYGGLKIQTISYDKTKESCKVILSGKKHSLGKVIGKGPWTHDPKKGFIKKVPPKNTIELSTPQEIVQFLSKHVTTPPEEIHYTIHVDKGLTISPYLHTPHDLDSAVFIGEWVWQESLGFRKIKNLRWTRQKIPPGKAEDFISYNKHILNLIPGFAVHEYAAQHALSFLVDTTGTLSFASHMLERDHTKASSLGKWVYIKNAGFFLRETESPFPLSPVPPHHVAEFIRKHLDQLKEFPGFFSKSLPIHGVGLSITYTKKKQISLIPHYSWEKPEYEKGALFYEEFGYLPELGFFILPPILTQTHLSRTISPSNKDEWETFFLEELPQLKKEFSCVVDPRLEPPHTLVLVCDSLTTEEALLTTKVPHSWQASFHWESEKGRVSSHELLSACLKKHRFFPSEAGLIDLTDDRFGWLSSAPLLKSTHSHRLATTDFFKIRAHEEFSLQEEISPHTTQLIQKLLQAAPQTPPILSSLHSTLRSYQQKGVEWLWYLYTSGLSGLLCDDMGVGKTHQAMALLCSVNDAIKQEGRQAHFLILCPTSLFWHWKEKLEAVLPHLSVFPYVGGNRCELSFHGNENIFLTTYGIWRNEVHDLKNFPFDIAIFDELQIAKNNVSMIWAALSQVKASMRLGLTGTPIENSINELKSLFDLLLPGYLPRITTAYAVQKKATKKTLLARYAHPFILRRRKEDVLLDLPPKTEEIRTTELIGEQKVLYKQIASRQSAHIVQQLHDESTPIPYMHIFALLSALKQICNHPAAYLHDIENYQLYESGKWDAFTELLEEARESGQKVIIFSHYLAMLDIISLHLKSKDIPFAEIRGSTKKRGEEIARFQKDPACKVFLGSLQAAGLGIDLTAGSVVIHYDRWWNAARENQATDRAHRIGQTRGVMVYKLLTTATVEERIDELISQKAQLFEDVIQFDDHRVMKQFNRQELLSLLTDINSV